MPLLKHRLHGDRLPPQPVQMPIPGWAGQPQPRADGSHEQPWHCTPFSESSRYGIELLYPFDEELRVTRFRGKVRLEADWGEPQDPDMMWPPFRTFGEDYYSYQLSLDLEVPNGWAVRAETHPRYYTDPTNTTPLAVPALIRTEWWPMIFFCIFKAPPRGVTHVFRKGEPFMQLIVIPSEPDLELEPMGEEESAERELQSRRIRDSRPVLSENTTWLSSTNTVFDGTYRHMLRAAKARPEGA